MLKSMGVESDALPCLCANGHPWWSVGRTPEVLAVVQRAVAAEDFDPDEFDTRFFDQNGRWCPQCGEPDIYCAKTFGLVKRDPVELHAMYAVVVDDGGTVYVDRRLRGAAVQENSDIRFAVNLLLTAWDDGDEAAVARKIDELRELVSDADDELPTIRTFDREGNEHNDVLRTPDGKIITEADIDDWVADAEEGYETHSFNGATDDAPCQDCGRRKGVHLAV